MVTFVTAECVAAIDHLQEVLRERFDARTLRVAPDRWLPDGSYAAVVVTQRTAPPAALVREGHSGSVECMLWAWALTRLQAHQAAGTLQSDHGEGISLTVVDRRTYADRIGIQPWGWEVGRALTAVDAPPEAYDHIYSLLS